MPHTDTIRVHTSARYRGLPVTVAGDDLTRLAAVAGYGTPHEIGRHHGQPRHAPRALPRRGRPPTRKTIHDAAENSPPNAANPSTAASWRDAPTKAARTSSLHRREPPGPGRSLQNYAAAARSIRRA